MLEVDPEAAAQVKRIFNLHANGDYSTATLADLLTAENIPATASRHGRWTADNVADLLKNVAYVGKTYSGRGRLKCRK